MQPDKDVVTVDGKRIVLQQSQHVYFMVNKPKVWERLWSVWDVAHRVVGSTLCCSNRSGPCHGQKLKAASPHGAVWAGTCGVCRHLFSHQEVKVLRFRSVLCVARASSAATSTLWTARASAWWTFSSPGSMTGPPASRTRCA